MVTCVTMSIEFFHNKLSMNPLNSMVKKTQPKGFDPRIALVDGQCANHYAVEPSVIAMTFRCSLVYALLLL